jgi:tetratricopeptide (TPR) repeat protein
MKKPLLVIALCCLFIIILGAGAVYYFVILPKQLTPAEILAQQVDKNLQSGRQLLNQNSPQSAIPWLQQAASQAVDLDQKSRAELNLGQAYLAAGMSQQGIALLKEVSLNETYPVGYRSTAAQNIVGYFKDGKDVNFALQYVFTGPTWSDFIKGTTPDATGMNTAIKNAYLWIASFDNSTSAFNVYYTLASWYGEDLSGQTGATQADEIVQTKKYIQLGDAMYPQVLALNATAKQSDPTGVPPFTVGVIGNALTLKARALAGLYRVGDASTTLNAVSTAFTQAITLLDSDPTGYSTSLYSHFHFADFLVKVNPTANAQKVTDTLTFLYSDPSQYSVNVFFQGFLKLYGAQNSIYRGTLTWKDIVIMTHIDPRFKSLLINLGWSVSDLQ